MVGEAADGVEAVARGRAGCGPTSCSWTSGCRGVDGIEATRQITRDAFRTSRVLVLTTYDLDEYVFEALTAGASGFLLKDCPPDDLIAAIRVVARGDALLAPSVTRRLIAEFTASRRPRVAAAAAARSPRASARCSTLVARGLNNAEIAGELFIGEATVKTHVGNLLTKLGCRDRVQLVVRAYEAGLVVPGVS